jgi:hypothetical protein
MSTEANKAVILHELEVCNAAMASKDATITDKLFDECFTEDFVNHEIPVRPDVAPGREGLKQQWHRSLGAPSPYEDGHFSMPEFLIAEGDLVAGLWRGQRTERATGKRVRGVCMRITRFVGGKIAEAWQLLAMEE